MQRIPLAILVGLVCALIACQGSFSSDDDAAATPTADDETTPAPQGQDACAAIEAEETSPTCGSGHTFYFDLTDPGRTMPFPSDLMTYPDPTSATGRRVYIGEGMPSYLIDILEMFDSLPPALNRVDGFGVTTAAMFPADVPPDPATLPDHFAPGPEDSVFCVAIDEHAAKVKFMPIEFEWHPDYDLMLVRPHVTLLQNTTYAIVVTDGVRARDGGCYAPGEDFVYLRSTVGCGHHPEASHLEPARQRFEPYFHFIEERVGVPRERIVAATFYATQAVTHDLEGIRDALKARAAKSPPTVKEWDFIGASDNQDGLWDGVYDTINWRWDGVFKYDDQARPVPNGTEEIKARLSLPDPDRFPQPWPVLIFMHGFNESRENVDRVGATLAEFGFAVIGFDEVFHGERGGNINTVVRELKMIDAFMPLKWRANFQQDVSDEMWLGHLVRNLADLDLAPFDVGGDGVPDLDTEHIAFASISLGSIHGGIVAAIDDQLGAMILNVGAQDYRSIVLNSPNGQTVVKVFAWLQKFLDFRFLSQMLVVLDLDLIVGELADPAAYAPYVIRHPLPGMPGPDRQLFHQMAAYDEGLGGIACGQTALRIGLPQVEPIVWRIPEVPAVAAPYAGAGSFQLDTDDHECWCSPEAQEQIGHYLTTWVETGVGEIIDPYH
jgi:hypothetical protein